MKSSAAVLFLFFSLSLTVIQVRCDYEDKENSGLTYRKSQVPAAPTFETKPHNYKDIEQGPPKTKKETVEKNSVHKNVKCADTEEYSRCDANPYCQRTCDNLHLHGIPCPRSRRSCIDGCICKKNFVRSKLSGGCIPVDQCGRVKH